MPAATIAKPLPKVPNAGVLKHAEATRFYGNKVDRDSKKFVTWLLDKDTVWSGFSRTNTPATVDLSTINTDWTQQTNNTWGTMGGGVLALKVNSAGVYTVAPTISISNGNGASGNTNQATATANLSGTSLTVPTLTKMGQDYISTAPSVVLSGGSGSGGALAIDTIQGNVLFCIPTGATGNKFGNYYTLGRTAAQDQRIDVFGHYVGNVNQFLIAECRMQFPASGGTLTTPAYVANLVYTAANAAPTLNVYAYNGTTFNNLNSGAITCTGLSSIAGHQYSVSLACTGVSPTTIATVVTDVTAATSFTAPTFTDSTAALQNPGKVGTGLNAQATGAWQTIDELTAYTLGGFSIAPSTVPLNNTTQSLTFTGIGTTWLSSTPTFTVSNSGSATSIVSQNIVSDTSATLVISTGASVGTATFTDPSTTATTPLSVAAMNPPAVTINASQTATPVITAGGPATNGVPPYTYVLYRSSNSNLNTLTNPPDPSGDPAAAIVNTQSSLSGGTTPTAYTDNSALANANYYVWKVTDSQSQAAWATQVFTVKPSPSVAKGVMGIGDSITAGSRSTDALCQWIVAVDVTNGGTTYTNPTITVNTTGPGSGATLGAHIVAGAIQYVYPLNPGTGYTNEAATFTFTITDSTGSGGALAMHSVGGGYMVALKRYLQTQYGYPDVNVRDCAVGGSTSNHWQPHGTTSNTTYNLESAEAAAGSAVAYPIWIYMIGANDVGGISAATYTTHVQTTVTALKTWASGNIRIVLVPPTWNSRSGAAGTLILQQFGAACQAIAAADPSHVTCLSPWNTLNTFQAHQELLSPDLLHPINSGYGVLGSLVAAQVAPLMALVSNGGATGNNPNGGNGPLTMTLPSDTQTVRVIVDAARRSWNESAATAKARRLAAR